jgi:beta-N-acetylhexosaminidase
MRRGIAAVVLLLAWLSTGALAKDKYQRAAPVHLDSEGGKWAQKTLGKLSLEEKIGQMLMVWARAEFLNEQSPEFQRLRDVIQKYHVGGFGLTVPVQSGLLVKSEPYEAAMLINQLQRESKLPLLIAADFERGLAMRLNGTTQFPQAMAFGAANHPEYARRFGQIVAQEARAIGVEWNWFPVADVNSNPANPIINTRAFSGDPGQVGALAAAYIRGAREGGMLTTAKHFPGHGDTDIDSHLSLARVNGDWRRLDSVELPPFRAAVAAGVDAVMVGHVAVPALDPDPGHVATNSPYIIQDVLRKQMGFRGVVISDALDMNGYMQLFESDPNPSGRAAVAAVKAGNDIALLPADLDGAYQGLLQAARNHTLSEAQINASVLKVLKAKASVGLHRSRLVDLNQLAKLVRNPEYQAEAQRMSDAAVTLVRDDAKLLPLARGGAAGGTRNHSNPYTGTAEERDQVLAVLFTDDARSEPGRVLERELRTRLPDAGIVTVDERNVGYAADGVLAAVAGAPRVIAAVFAAPVPGRTAQPGGEPKSAIALAEKQAGLLNRMLERAAGRMVVIALGSPYLASEFPAVQTYLCTFSNAPVSETSAARALFGEIPVSGRLPVDIPGVAQRGTGIDRAAVRKGGWKNAEKGK